jgi:two-component system NarL family sensor kinase
MQMLLIIVCAKKVFLTCIGIFIFAAVLAQNNNQQIDELNLKADRFSYKPDSMIIYAKEAYRLSIENKYKSGEASSLKYMGIYEHYLSNFDKALKMYMEALSIFESLKNKLEIAKTTLSIAIAYNNINDHVNSINYGMRSLKIFEELKDAKGQGKILNLLGISCAKQGEFKRAKIYFLQYNRLSKKGRDTVDIAYSYNNLGGVNRDLRIIDSALYYFKIASQLFKKKNYLPGVALADKNIGSIYYERKDYKNALLYAKKSLETSLITGDKRNTAYSYQEMATCYRALKDTANAYINYKKALTIAIQIKDFEVKRDVYNILSEMDRHMANYKSAYENLKASFTAHDSLLNAEKTKVVQELTTKYETVTKEKAIRSLQQESTIQKLRLKQGNIFLGIALILLVMGGILWYLFYNQRSLKAKVQLQEEVNKQQDLTARAVLVAEERERRRIAGDLHDGVGQLLSAALMNLNGMFQKLKLTGEMGLQAKQTLSIVNDSYDEMRSISHQMMPNALLKSGLAFAVKEFLDKIDKDMIKINLETIGLKQRLDEQTETVLYRVIQETVSNVIKHAGANRLDIVLIKDEEGISITIEDNGKGFDKSKTDLRTGMGMGNILSRVEFLKGTVDIDSTIGKGTLVAIFIPL